jgi:urease accessory protein
LLHPPGGLVPGDSLALDLTVDSGAHALVTTPAAAKIYRSDGRQASVQQRLKIADGGTLEWLPQETIVFDAADIALATEVELAGDARFVGWEILCLGRTARGERFTRGLCQQRFDLRRNGRPVVIERSRFTGGGALLAAPYGLQDAPVLGTMIVSRVFPVDELRELAAAVLAPDHASVTALEGALVCRYIGGSAERARTFFARVWTVVRPLLCARPPSPPRIWLT